MLTSAALTFAPGNPFPVHLTLSSALGKPVTGLANQLTGYVAATKGGAKITTPDTTLVFTEDAGSPTAARDYDAALTVGTVDALLAGGPSSLWVALVLPDGFTVWAEFPCVKWRELE